TPVRHEDSQAAVFSNSVISCTILFFLQPWVMVIHKDHFVPVTHAVGVEMVGIPYSHVRISPYYPSLGDSLERNSPGELGRSHCFLSSPGTRPRFPRTSTSYTDPYHDLSRLCLVSSAPVCHAFRRSEPPL